MTELEKIIEQAHDGSIDSCSSCSGVLYCEHEVDRMLKQTAHAVIELIRERMPELYKGDGYGKNGQEYCQDVMNLLNSLR